jgi:hypothetical protein
MKDAQLASGVDGLTVTSNQSLHDLADISHDYDRKRSYLCCGKLGEHTEEKF